MRININNVLITYSPQTVSRMNNTTNKWSTNRCISSLKVTLAKLPVITIFKTQIIKYCILICVMRNVFFNIAFTRSEEVTHTLVDPSDYTGTRNIFLMFFNSVCATTTTGILLQKN